MSEHPILKELDEIQKLALSKLDKASHPDELAAWKTAHLGRSAPVMQVFTKMGALDKDTRPLVGQKANQVKILLEATFEERQRSISLSELQSSLAQDKLDVTLPGRKPYLGRLHPLQQTLRRIIDIFAEMGFQVYRTREVETDEFNFELLNIPAHHPARDMWDTFHMQQDGVILRTHTSPGQIHVMRQYAPEPIRAILPGMCYRYEQMDARHESQILQVEVLAVGKNISLAHLKGTVEEFARAMYGANVRTRLRPSYFPFTEPSGEVDIECFICNGEGCRVCSNSGWLEIMGCGMVHPRVLQNGGYDPEVYSGFAAGMGVERVTMLRNHVDEIRHFYANDIRFLEQF